MIAAASGWQIAVLSSSALPMRGKAMIRQTPVGMRIGARFVGAANKGVFTHAPV
jgi:hypothetical protein